MNAITLKIMGWLSDDRLTHLRAKAKEQDYMFIEKDDIDAMISELIARRLKDKKEISLAH